MGYDDWGMMECEPLDEDRDGNNEPVTLVFDILIHPTKDAYYLQFGDDQVWVPKSISKINMTIEGNTVEVPEWFMIQEGLEDYADDDDEVRDVFDKVVRKNIKNLKDDIPF